MDKVKFTIIFTIVLSYSESASSFKSYGYPEGFSANLGTSRAETYYDYHIELDNNGAVRKIVCPPYHKHDDLREECAILKVFNRTLLDMMDSEQAKMAAETCACQLLEMYVKFEQVFNTRDASIRKAAHLVTVRTNETLSQTKSYPTYFWTDTDLVSFGVSVYTSTRDYFHKTATDPSFRLSPEMRQQVSRDPNWRNIRFACQIIANDRYSLYRYMENLMRLSPSVFFRMVLTNELFNIVYQASKSCKFLLLVKLDKYKLRPDDQIIIVANRSDGETASTWYNVIEDDSADAMDIETIVYKARSLLPNNCEKGSGEDMEDFRCPITFNQGDTGDTVKIWLANNVTEPTFRSMAAIQCGCQLLQYNSTWDAMIRDPDVAVMARALTNYMNNNRVSDVANSPSWVLYGWFRDVMGQLSESRKNSIKEVMNIKRGGQEDPTSPTGKDKSSEALDLLRRGCLVVVFNYDPVTRRKGRFRLVQYLDDLQTISSDSTFVFQLTLQDLNLFKIYALSRMCQPIM